MVETARIIADNLSRSEPIFVFPSEIAADFWRRAALADESRRVVWHDRFLSWDRFKEETLALSRTAVPINRVVRTLFAADLLTKNASGTPLLGALVDPAYAASSASFLSTITRILPELARYREARAAAGGTARAAIDRALDADLDLLWLRYRAFLEEHGMFEPAYEKPASGDLAHEYLVFFPEIIEDWNEFGATLPSARVKTVSVAGAENPLPGEILQFGNARREVRAALLAIAERLDGGMPPSDIALSVPALESWLRMLTDEAALREVPLDIRQGRPLSRFPATRFLGSLRAVAAEGFSLESMKSLLLDAAPHWREASTLRRLVQFGVDHHCAGRTGRRDPWLAALRAAETSDAPLLRAYEWLSREIAALVAARSFSALKSAVQRFIRAHLDVAAWAPPEVRVLQSALDALNDLVAAEARVAGLAVGNRYDLWIADLGERIYVQRPERGGVPVYPFRVAAGIEPAYHVVLGASQSASEIEWPRLRFLRDDERAALGVAERNPTDAFFAVYARSGAAVRFSFSVEDPRGVQLPPGSFVRSRGVRPPSPSEDAGDTDAYVEEPAVWSGGRSVPRRCYRMQRVGLEAMGVHGFAPRLPDFTVSAITDRELVAALRDRIVEEGSVSISPTRLDRFNECPFAFLVSVSLGIDQPDFTIPFEDPRRIGELYHDCFRRFFTHLHDHGGRFHRDELPAYRETMKACVGEAFEHFARRGRALVDPVWNALRISVAERMAQFLEIEAAAFDGYEVEAVEAELGTAFADQVVLDGRIDRVSRHGAALAVFDYKKTVSKETKRLLRSLLEAADDGPASDRTPGDEAGGDDATGDEESAGSAVDLDELPSLQVPFYVHLLERGGGSVLEALYYDVERARYESVFRDVENRASTLPAPWTDRTGIERLIGVLGDSISTMARRVGAGDYRVNNPRSGCTSCAVRAVCRMKYGVR